jgi:TatD DNase family protein
LNRYNDGVEAELKRLVMLPGAVAWGEIGLDYFRNLVSLPIQRQTFERQLAAAVALNRPVIIHSRDAAVDTYNVLTTSLPRDWKIHLHCFTGLPDEALKLIEHFPNLYVGFTGAVTHYNSRGRQVRDAVRQLPLSRLLLETDGPFMVPEPASSVEKTKVAHPGHIPLVAHAIATAKGVPLATVLETCRGNTRNMYGI